MNLVYSPLICASILNMVLGIAVYRTNSKRGVNQQFLLLTIVIAFWLHCIQRAFMASDSNQLETVEFWVRQASTLGLLIPVSFELLRLAIKHYDYSFTRIIAQSRLWLSVCLCFGIFCQTDLYMTHVVSPTSPDGTKLLAEPVYGAAFPLYVFFFVISLLLLVYRFFRDLKTSRGLQRLELQYILVGCASCIFVGITFASVIPLFTNNSQTIKYAPLNVIFMDAIIGYGIATKRILEVAYLFRRGVAYSLATLYLVLIYLGIWSVGSLIVPLFGGDGSLIPHMLAALAVAYSLAPAHGLMQRFSQRLFITTHDMDVSKTIEKANEVLQSILTIPDLMQQFCGTISEAVGTDRVLILLRSGGEFVQQFPPPADSDKLLKFSVDDPLMTQLKQSRKPIVSDELKRQRRTKNQAAQIERLRRYTAHIVLGIYTRRELEGILLLGPRLSGKVYSRVEQNVLKILCDQLAVAFENAQLFTQVQDSNIYNKILVENLVDGVIAVNADGDVTVYNSEAQRLCCRGRDEVLHRHYRTLPAPLAAAIETTLSSNQKLRDVDLVLENGDSEPIPLRLGSTNLHNHSGARIGALIVFTDLSAIKTLENQIRRGDRLASIGTLSTSMAHEIKNPLVAIKTFAQLLPERYQDQEFRDSFNSLMCEEIDRIDTIVNQLLAYSRPSPPNLEPANLNSVVKHSLDLIQHRLKQLAIHAKLYLEADTDIINADVKQLEQVFFNIFLNAAEAMANGGRIDITTSIIKNSHQAPDGGLNNGTGGFIRATIVDSGRGIDPDKLSSIFDPFYTSKPEGTGMGLAVAHRIVSEHGGTIDVESVYDQSTTFHVKFPLLQTEALT